MKYAGFVRGLKCLGDLNDNFDAQFPRRRGESTGLFRRPGLKVARVRVIHHQVPRRFFEGDFVELHEVGIAADAFP
jgi:hypothetical protein